MVMFTKHKVVVDEVKDDLNLNMKLALVEYTRTLHEYNRISAEYGEESSIAVVFYSKLNHFRTQYHELRLQYETLYGDVDAYESSLSRISKWSRTSGTRLLMQPLYRGVAIG